jgi:hypothetical protein
MIYPHEVYVENVQGPVAFESYVAGVVTAENGRARHAALQAQAVAARTFTLREIRDRPSAGTARKPLRNSEFFQVYRPKASERAIQATNETAGIVCRYKGELIICNYVAGAFWNAALEPREDPTKTEWYVTYNKGKTGSAVKPSPISNMKRSDNRGCMSQNGADDLARIGYDYPAILRFFYGADLEVAPLVTSLPIQPVPAGPAKPAQPAAAARDDGPSPLPVLALAALVFLEQGGQ